MKSADASKSANRELLSIGGIVLAFVLFFAVNIIATRTLGNATLDLTSDKLYTLSPGTKAVLAKIEEPLTFRFYYSERLGREIPNYAVFAGRVREMLQSYASAAKGKIRLQVIDPQPFSDDEDRAVGLGLQGVPVTQGGDLVYFGLVGSNSADKDEVIPFFQTERERFLEYDLTKLIYNLSTTKKPSVGLITALPMDGNPASGRPSQPWAIYTQMVQFFDIKPIEQTADAIPDDIGVLVLIHPSRLPGKLLFAIDQFVLRGGRAMVFVDPHAEGEMTRPGIAAQTGITSSDLKPLFDSWGLEMVPQRAVGDRLAAIQVNASADTRVRAVNYLAWLALDGDNFSRSDILTAQLQTMQMASAGILKAKEGATTTMSPLIQSSAQSMQIDVEKIKFRPDPVALLAEFKPENERYTMAARVSGRIKTAYPDGPPPEPAPQDQAQGAPPPPPPAPTGPAPDQIMESRVPLNVIVVADTDMLEDRFWAQVQNFFGQSVIVPEASNGDFVINAIDNLLGSDELISLRTRGQSARPFTLVQDIQRDAELQFREKERQLTERMKATEGKLQELQGQSAGSPAEPSARQILTREQQEAIDGFRAELLSTRRELRDVQHELRRNIDNLDRLLKFVNIGLMPILIGIVAIIVGVVRLRRRAASRRPVTAAT